MGESPVPLSFSKKRVLRIASDPRFLLTLLILAYLFLLLQGTRSLGFVEPSDARYAEVAREMIAGKDFLTPRMDGVLHVTKPPMAYWLAAAGMVVFGENSFGAHAGLAASACLVLFLTYLLGASEENRKSGILAASLLAAFPLFFFMGRILTTDMFVTAFVTGGVLLWCKRIGGDISARWFSILFGLTAAGAFLTKGPIPFLYWALIMIPYSLWRDKGRSLKPLASPVLWMTAAACSAWWFVALGEAHPGLLHYLVSREAVEAAYSAKRFHPGPFYYYIPVLIAGIFPWWVVMWGGWKGARRAGKLWWIWALLPVIVWSFFPAKLIPYILPTMPAFALLAAHSVLSLQVGGRRTWASTGILAAVVLAGAAAVAVNPGRGAVLFLPVILLAAAAFFALGAALSGATQRPGAALLLLVGAMGLVWAGIPSLAKEYAPGLKLRRSLGMAIRSGLRPQDGILEYRTTLYSIPFYSGRLVAAYRNGFDARQYVGKRPPNMLRSDSHLQAYLALHPSLWIVADRKYAPEIRKRFPGASVVLREGNHVLYATPPLAERLRSGGRARPRTSSTTQ